MLLFILFLLKEKEQIPKSFGTRTDDTQHPEIIGTGYPFSRSDLAFVLLLFRLFSLNNRSNTCHLINAIWSKASSPLVKNLSRLFGRSIIPLFFSILIFLVELAFVFCNEQAFFQHMNYRGYNAPYIVDVIKGG